MSLALPLRMCICDVGKREEAFRGARALLCRGASCGTGRVSYLFLIFLSVLFGDQMATRSELMDPEKGDLLESSARLQFQIENSMQDGMTMLFLPVQPHPPALLVEDRRCFSAVTVSSCGRTVSTLTGKKRGRGPPKLDFADRQNQF